MALRNNTYDVKMSIFSCVLDFFQSQNEIVNPQRTMDLENGTACVCIKGMYRLQWYSKAVTDCFEM